MINILKKYIFPGLIIQSLVMGGGYGTGRELVEFFMKLGPVRGLFAMAVAAIVWSSVIAISFELARIARAYDYRTFIKSLLGRHWIVFEITFIFGVVLIISVVGAVAGELLNNMFNIHHMLGSLIIMSLITVIVYYGTAVLEKLFVTWSILIYIAYITLVAWCAMEFGDSIKETFTLPETDSKWALKGLQYAAYNMGAIPVALVFTRHLKRRRETLIAGALAGPITMLPGLLLYLALLSGYPEILSAPVPTNLVLDKLGSPIFAFAFQIILLGTVIDTGVGFIHGFNERVAVTMDEIEKKFTNFHRSLIGLTFFVFSVFVANFIGLIDLVAKGFGLYGWAVLVTFVLPVMTFGIWRIWKTPADQAPAAQ